jgi:hypothetical protein
MVGRGLRRSLRLDVRPMYMVLGFLKLGGHEMQRRHSVTF